MAAKVKGYWRIKDVETGLYYSKRRRLVDPNATTYSESHSNWSNYGDIWVNKGSAESMVTRLTRTVKAKRDTDAKIVLYGNKESAKIRIVEATVSDKED